MYHYHFHLAFKTKIDIRYPLKYISKSYFGCDMFLGNAYIIIIILFRFHNLNLQGMNIMMWNYNSVNNIREALKRSNFFLKFREVQTKFSLFIRMMQNIIYIKLIIIKLCQRLLRSIFYLIFLFFILNIDFYPLWLGSKKGGRGQHLTFFFETTRNGNILRYSYVAEYL